MRTIVTLVSAIGLWAADPGAFEERKTRTRALLERQDFTAALEQAQALNREWPDDIASYQLMAAAHLGLGNYDEAEKALQWMLDLRIGKADAQGWLMVARFRELTGDIDGAIEAVNLAHGRLAPGQEHEARTLLTLSGRLHLIAGKLVLAERAFEESLKDSGSDPVALEALARVRIAQGRRDEAIRILRGLTKSHSNPRSLYLLAEASGDASDFAAFERAARERLAQPDNANRELVLFLAGPGKRPAEALEIARREHERRKDVFTLDALAVALFAAGHPEEARVQMKRALAVGTRDPEILAHAARVGVKTE